MIKMIICAALIQSQIQSYIMKHLCLFEQIYFLKQQVNICSGSWLHALRAGLLLYCLQKWFHGSGRKSYSDLLSATLPTILKNMNICSGSWLYALWAGLLCYCLQQWIYGSSTKSSYDHLLSILPIILNKENPLPP